MLPTNTIDIQFLTTQDLRHSIRPSTFQSVHSAPCQITTFHLRDLKAAYRIKEMADINNEELGRTKAELATVKEELEETRRRLAIAEEKMHDAAP